MTVSEYDIFDCHHHVGDVSAFFGVQAPGADDESEVETRLAIMDAAGSGRRR